MGFSQKRTEGVGHGGGVDSLRQRVYQGGRHSLERRRMAKTPRGRRGRTVNAGERVVIAEVIRDERGWLDLLVRDCTIASEKPGGEVLLLAKNIEVRRKRHTIEKGKPERLLWSDETVRAFLVSKFLGDRSADDGLS